MFTKLYQKITKIKLTRLYIVFVLLSIITLLVNISLNLKTFVSAIMLNKINLNMTLFTLVFIAFSMIAVSMYEELEYRFLLKPTYPLNFKTALSFSLFTVGVLNLILRIIFPRLINSIYNIEFSTPYNEDGFSYPLPFSREIIELSPLLITPLVFVFKKQILRIYELGWLFLKRNKIQWLFIVFSNLVFAVSHFTVFYFTEGWNFKPLTFILIFVFAVCMSIIRIKINFKTVVALHINWNIGVLMNKSVDGKYDYNLLTLLFCIGIYAIMVWVVLIELKKNAISNLEKINETEVTI
jgi:hypothetical protein